MAKSPAYRGSIRTKSVRELEQLHLERGRGRQLWGVTSSELRSLTDPCLENIVLLRRVVNTPTAFLLRRGQSTDSLFLIVQTDC